jgi:tetratricopeptide (TPR) repeat protein
VTVAFTAEHHIDAETLREVLHRPAELAAWLDRALAAGSTDHTALGVAARLSGRLQTAEEQLTRALELAGTVADRLRLAHVYQWQGRFDDALALLARCRREAADDHTAGFVAQHTGTCHYDRGDWAAAGECFATAARLRAGASAELRASSRSAADAAHACLAARAIAVELDRLVPAVHYRAAAAGSGLYRRHGAPPSAPVLIELRSLLAAGPVSLPVVRGIYRCYPQLDPAVDELVAAGWLERSDGAVRASGPCAALLADLRSTMDDAAEVVWGGVSAVPALAGTLSAMARAAVGASPGPTFDALVGTAGDGTPAAVLLDRISALRHHRADCSAAAGGAAAADRMAARPYRPLQPSARQSLLDALRALPS